MDMSNMKKTKRFRTSDGYELHRAGLIWTDGDLVFNDYTGLPVDAFGEPLNGEFLPEEEAPAPQEARLRSNVMLAKPASMTIATECPICKTKHDLIVPVEGFLAWKRGKRISEALPNLSIDEREMLKTGICVPCWNELFKSLD